MHSQSFRALAVALALSCCVTVHAQTQPDPAIVFGRDVLNPRTGESSEALFVTDRWGITLAQVTSPRDGARDAEASWSPDGGHLVFARYGGGLESQLLVVDRQGERVNRLTSGQRDDHNPVWGPGSLIAFESAPSNSQPDCLRVVDAQTRRQRELFCAVIDYNGGRTDVQSPTWSADGNSVYVAASQPAGRLGEAWFGDVYRVEVATGAATRVAQVGLDEPAYGIIAPDGRTAIFHDEFYEDGLIRLDLADGTRTSLGRGGTPVFSNDGRQLAFVRTITVGTWPDSLQLAQVFVADLDTGALRQVTNHRDPTLRFSTLDWSAQGTHVLVQHWNEGDLHQQLAILDLATAEFWPLPQGTASDQAWFDR